MVKDYIAKYGGTAADINADVAEAYSVGEITAQAVTATKGVDNKKITSFLHSGITLQTVQGPVKFNSSGENTVAQKFIFQWQKAGSFVQVLPSTATGSVAVLHPKPNWSS
jgi:ABC-type branched-subunit amino acid transport system substrate-binding protein